jgi:hypothetical protein
MLTGKKNLGSAASRESLIGRTAEREHLAPSHSPQKQTSKNPIIMKCTERHSFLVAATLTGLALTADAQTVVPVTGVTGHDGGNWPSTLGHLTDMVNALDPGWATDDHNTGMDTSADPSDPSTWTYAGNDWKFEWKANSRLDSATSTNAKIGWTVIDFGGPVDGLENMYLWNVRFQADTENVETYNIYYSSSPTAGLPPMPNSKSTTGDYDFSSGGWTLLNTAGALSLGTNNANNSAPQGVVALGGIEARYVGIEILTAGDETANRVGLAQVEFTALPEPSTATVLTITPATAPDTGFDLEWESQAGKLYNLRTSPDLAGEIPAWTLVEGDIEATPPANVRNVSPGDATRFYVLEEFDAPPPPPLLEEDFEDGDGNFTAATVEGTDWEHGTPDSSGIGGTVDSGNGGSANAWATNLGTVSSAAADPGFYADPTHTALRSPVIDLTGAAGAELTFAEAADFPDTDTAVVNLINAATDDVIAEIHVSEDGDIGNAEWNGVGPIDLAAGVGQEVRIEWRFEGVGGTTDDFMGWYVDDVVVTETAP